MPPRFFSSSTVSGKRGGGGILDTLVKLVLLGGILFLSVYTGYKGVHLFNEWSASTVETISALTWNIAAINNNPFEYWISSDNPKYNKFMEKVSNYIKDPADKEVAVSTVFTEEMFSDLLALMQEVKWNGLDEVKQRWDSEYKNRKVISEFIRDDLIGLKRLTSMPDRVTNTISALSKDVMRPTVINCYDKNLNNMQTWWNQWKEFMFKTKVSTKTKAGVKESYVYDMLSPIKKSKYPSITNEEEKISIPLQTLNLAIFDAILIHIVNQADPQWHSIRDEICSKLNRHKSDRVIEILSTTYGRYDLMFLQEVGSAFLSKITASELTSRFNAIVPTARDEHRDQNSIILLNKSKFRFLEELTGDLANFSSSKGSQLPIANGDLIVISVERIVDNSLFLLASFHGDTNGLATRPIVQAVHDYAVQRLPHHLVLFGMDANTYEKPADDQYGVVDFAKFYSSINMNSCYGLNPNPKNYTTFHARTYLQPQLNKAITLEEKDTKGDKNPKDFIVFFKSDFTVVETRKDNTGNRKYTENMVFPTLTFPSDHGITSTFLKENKIVSN